jgi:hypothetical protein
LLLSLLYGLHKFYKFPTFIIHYFFLHVNLKNYI